MLYSKEAFGGRGRGGAEFWHGYVFNLGHYPNDRGEVRYAEKRLLAKLSNLSGQIEKERSKDHSLKRDKLEAHLLAHPAYVPRHTETPGTLRKIHRVHINHASMHVVKALRLLLRINDDDRLNPIVLEVLEYADMVHTFMEPIVKFITGDDKYAGAQELPGFKKLRF
jgi:hypothetical protein